jgi:hypothetical protein
MASAFVGREGAGELHECGHRIAGRLEGLAHEEGGMGVTAAHRREAYGAAVLPAAQDSFVHEAVEDGGHGCIGVLG